MGWAHKSYSDSYKLREDILNHVNFDILGVAETHFLGDQILQIDGYQWYGQNRKNLHKNAKRGSGGVGFLIRSNLMNFYNVSIVDDSFEGIMLLKFISKIENKDFYTCVCYLPPIESTRNIDATDVFNQLIVQIHLYCKNLMFTTCICGDFNARCSNFEDFISGEDEIPDRHVLDFTSNKYGELLCEFLIDANRCSLNGRNYISNDFTCIRPQETSLVDYCIIPHEDLDKYLDFNVQTVSYLINELDVVDSTSALTTKPDHSVLSWKMETTTPFLSPTNEPSGDLKSSFILYERNIPGSFLEEKIQELEEFERQIQNNLNNQSDTDNTYTKFVEIIKGEMHDKLNRKVISVSCGQNNKKRKTNK